MHAFYNNKLKTSTLVSGFNTLIVCEILYKQESFCKLLFLVKVKEYYSSQLNICPQHSFSYRECEESVYIHSHTCGQPCTAMGMAAWGCGRDTLTGTAGVSVWTAGAGASTDTTCCSPDTAGAQPGLNFTDICELFSWLLLAFKYNS